MALGYGDVCRLRRDAGVGGGRCPPRGSAPRQGVPLAPAELLAAVVASPPAAHPGRLHGLRVHDARAGLGIPAELFSLGSQGGADRAFGPENERVGFANGYADGPVGSGYAVSRFDLEAKTS